MKLHTEADDKNKGILENLERNIKETNEQLTRQTQELENLKKKIPLTEKSLRNATDELAAIKMKESQLIDLVNKERGQLEEIKSSMTASRSKSRVLDALMQQKREGNCPGLFGRLVIILF